MYLDIQNSRSLKEPVFKDLHCFQRFTLFARCLCSTGRLLLSSLDSHIIENSRKALFSKYLDICCFVSALSHRIFRMDEWMHNESKQNKLVVPGLSRIHYFLEFLPS